MFTKFFVFFLLSFSILNAQDYSPTIKDKKIYPMGKKIYEKKCSKITSFQTKIELNSLITKLCKPLNAKYSEALSIYLWDKQSASENKSVELIPVHKDEKCPICGMWVYKYPKWVAQIQYKDSHLSFDGVKDLMKYYLTHEDKGERIVVREYYSQKALDGRQSYFVIGSDVYGPMGNELIPFLELENAETFMMDHRGKKILKFNDIKMGHLE